MKDYKFWGWEHADVFPADKNYSFIKDPRKLYDILTSEQFGSEILDYEDSTEQFREDHFAKEEKKERYEYLKRRQEETMVTRANGICSQVIL